MAERTESSIWIHSIHGIMQLTVSVFPRHTFFLQASNIEKAPNTICGDMDSIRPEVKAYYATMSVEFVEDTDQHSTDFMKSLKFIDSIASRDGRLHRDWAASIRPPQRRRDWPQPDIVVLGGLGGRADQAFSQIHHLYLADWDSSLENIGRLYMITPESIIFKLRRGRNVISTPVGPGLLTENVGIIPVGKPSRITTRGLEWDVTDWQTAFGGQVSTSNHIKCATVEVKTTESVLFTVELAPMESSDSESEDEPENESENKPEDESENESESTPENESE